MPRPKPIFIWGDHVHNCKPAAFESCLRFLLGDRSAALKAAKVDRFVDSDEEMREPKTLGYIACVMELNRRGERTRKNDER
ncbi:hypothetical protein PGTUg99_036052 [Puccinia graminis f. sp. tritici]|uniref:Uncharacterized protein n=1 Tax=Puccinia graminis f. sp. tritici TaxID=56615 RepID=A0A5B0P325_PUCGR|nr:hypothetical protein PGTUg99_036052 [Puccinia graminis f. sp. tritici]